MESRHISDRAFIHTDEIMEHFHVPYDPSIQSTKIHGRIKTGFCRAWIGETERLIAQKPETLSFCKIVGIIDMPYLWESQIIIFYDNDYYNNFWDRNHEIQQWTRMETKRSLLTERNIKTKLPEMLIHEVNKDEEKDGREYVTHSDLWCYGELPARKGVTEYDER